MNKKVSIIIWVIAILAVIAAAYTFYSKNKTQSFVTPSQESAAASSAATASKDTSNTADSSGQSSESTKIMAPDFTLKDMDGNEVKLSDYKGKVVFLNFWAVWCKYCKLEMPDLNEFGKELEKGNDAVILAVDVQESQDTVNEYLTSNNIDLKVLLDQDGSVAQTYGISGYPTTFVINKDGSLYTYISGMTDKETLSQILDKINKE